MLVYKLLNVNTYLMFIYIPNTNFSTITQKTNSEVVLLHLYHTMDSEKIHRMHLLQSKSIEKECFFFFFFLTEVLDLLFPFLILSFFYFLLGNYRASALMFQYFITINSNCLRLE